METKQYEARMWRPEFKGSREELNPETRKWEDVPYTSPAQWAVYDIESGVRLAYSKSEEAAKAAADKWNSGSIPKAAKNQAESARYLKKILKPGDTVNTSLNHVSRSGMSRRITLLIAKDSEVINISWHAARAMGEPIKNRAGWVQDVGIEVGGCGMDLGFEIVYRLSSSLYPDGFDCVGNRCPSNDHCNRVDAKHHDAGGYALRHRWL